MQVMRQPRRERSPGLEPLFERCTASGAPHSLHRKPTHDCSVSLSAACFVVATCVGRVVEHRLPPGSDSSRMAIVVGVDYLFDHVHPQLFPAVVLDRIASSHPRRQPVRRFAEKLRRRPEREGRLEDAHEASIPCSRPWPLYRIAHPNVRKFSASPLRRDDARNSF